LLHLDIKPENIMVDDKDNTILIDFGASKMIEKTDGESTSSSLTCTPGYAPSELMEQKMSNFGAWTDIYSLGATLFKLLTGNQPPTPGDINEDGLPAMPGISTPMVNLVTKMMKPVRKQRPQSIANLRALVDSLSDNIADSQKSPKTQIIDNVDTSNKTIPLTDKGKSSTTGKPGHIKLRPILIGLGIVSLIVIGYNLSLITLPSSRSFLLMRLSTHPTSSSCISTLLSTPQELICRWLYIISLKTPTMSTHMLGELTTMDKTPQPAKNYCSTSIPKWL
jgi:serine/threonine protein kinase